MHFWQLYNLFMKVYLSKDIKLFLSRTSETAIYAFLSFFLLLLNKNSPFLTWPSMTKCQGQVKVMTKQVQGWIEWTKCFILSGL